MPSYPNTISVKKNGSAGSSAAKLASDVTMTTYTQVAAGGDHYSSPTGGRTSVRELLAAMEPSDWIGFLDPGGSASPGYSARGYQRASGADTYLDLSVNNTVLIVATATGIAITGLS